MVQRTLLVLALSVAVAAGCKPRAQQADMDGIAEGTTSPAPAPSAGAEPTATTPDAQADGVAVQAFDPASVPGSTAQLGAFPVIALPKGYAPQNDPVMQTHARFPFWLGQGVHWVEGQAWSAWIQVDDEDPAAEGKTFSELELRRNLETALEQAGAKKLFDGKLPDGLYSDKPWEDEILGAHNDAVNGMNDKHVTVHVIRTANREVWVQLGTDEMSAQMVVVENKPFVESFQALETFPYLAPPADYDERNTPIKRDFDRFPFWDGKRFEWAEGRLLAQDFDVDTDKARAIDRRYSLYDVRRNIEAWMARNGGEKLFEGVVPKTQLEALGEKDAEHYGVLTHHDSNPVLVYRTRRGGKELWLQADLGYLAGGWVIVEREGMAQTAGLLPAAELKQQLDSAGKVALQVNFATDKTEILPESQPQIEQVAQLLKDDPALKLAVNGHTDNTGDAVHNQTLSEGRAKSVVAALAAKGIDAARLSAKGYGDTQPVADNGNEDGKAKNRRVELVKQP